MVNPKFPCCTLNVACTQIPDIPMSGKKIDERTTLVTRIANIWFTANGFKRYFKASYNRLKKITKKKGFDASVDMQTEDIFSVCAVNALLATELYLKMIYAYDSLIDTSEYVKYYGGHKVDGLFCALNDKRKATIINHLKNKRMVSNIGELCGFLSVHKNDFVDWRYIFEAQSDKDIRLDMFSELLNILSKITLNIIETQSRPLLSNNNPKHSVLFSVKATYIDDD